ncbi:MAG: hypothetical protein AAF642_04660 [Pseudomonadota bacterium]
MAKSRLADWANIAEIVGTLAFVVSLIFVGVQISQNTAATRASASQAVHSSFADWYQSVQGDPELLSLSTKGMADYGALSPTEKSQFIALFMSFSLDTQDAFYKWRDGSLDPELWRTWEMVSMNLYSTQGGKAFWQERRYLFAESYQDFIENDLMTREPHPDARPWGADIISE